MMPICIICQGDGVLRVGTSWYCVDHVDWGFLATARMVARVLGHDEEEAQAKAMEWVREL